MKKIIILITLTNDTTLNQVENLTSDKLAIKCFPAYCSSLQFPTKCKNIIFEVQLSENYFAGVKRAVIEKSKEISDEIKKILSDNGIVAEKENICIPIEGLDKIVKMSNNSWHHPCALINDIEEKAKSGCAKFYAYGETNNVKLISFNDIDSEHSHKGWQEDVEKIANLTSTKSNYFFCHFSEV